jgi:hypothetical protein
MSFRGLRSRALIIWVGGLSIAGSQAWAAGEGRIFGGIADNVVEHVFRNNEIGSSIALRVSGLTAEGMSEMSYRSFLERIKWGRNQPLRTQLQEELAQIERRLQEFRVSQSRVATLEAGKPLPLDEQKFLDEAVGVLRKDTIEEMVRMEERSFIKAYLGPRDPVNGSSAYRPSAETHVGADAVSLPGPRSMGPMRGIEPPPRVEPRPPVFDPATGQDLRDFQLNWWKKLGIRVNATRRFVGALTLAEGDWRNIFVRSGKAFTAEDLATIRKYNRLLDGINDYAHLRLVVRAFANEPSAVYTRLTELSADVTSEYAKGFMTIDNYVNAMKAAGRDLPLNDIVYEAQKRILTVIERCDTLGGKLNGKRLGDGEVVRAERNVAEAEEQLHRVEAQLRIDQDLGDSRVLRKHLADRDLARQRLDLAVRTLEDKSFEFVRNRDLIEIFANLREGKINWESVQRFDMADPFFVAQERIDAWEELYIRSLARSMNRQVLHEVSLALRAQVGETRKIVRELNKLTQQVVGRMFTDTTVGQAFQRYAQHILTVGLIRSAKIFGVPISYAVAEEISDHQIKKFILSLGAEPSEGPSGSPSKAPLGIPAGGGRGGPGAGNPFSPSPAGKPSGGAGSTPPPAGSGVTPGAGIKPAGGLDVPPLMRPRPNPNPNPNPNPIPKAPGSGTTP